MIFALKRLQAALRNRTLDVAGQCTPGPRTARKLTSKIHKHIFLKTCNFARSTILPSSTTRILAESAGWATGVWRTFCVLSKWRALQNLDAVFCVHEGIFQPSRNIRAFLGWNKRLTDVAQTLADFYSFTTQKLCETCSHLVIKFILRSINHPLTTFH